MLAIHDVTMTHRRDLRVLISDFSFQLQPGDRVALIGEEGNGKSTLLAWLHDPALVEAYALVEGRSNRARVRTGYLAQLETPERPALPPAALLPPGYAPGQLARFAAELGLDPGLLDEARPLAAFSGGEQIKLRLLAILAETPDVLLLDEPSNDLDLAALAWLEAFIAHSRLPLIFVSHDETLLERTANVIVHLEQLWRRSEARHQIARCGYADYVATRELAYARQRDRAANERRELAAREARHRRVRSAVDYAQDTVSRQAPGEARRLKRKMAQMLAGERRLERMRENLTPRADREEALDLRFAADVGLPASKLVLDWSRDALYTEDGRFLAGPLRLVLRGPERIGITGANGSGKTTLLRAIWRELEGRRDLRPALMPQDYREAMALDQRPIDWLDETGVHATRDALRSWLGAARFSGEEMARPIGELSGGQRAKLFFIHMIHRRADVLILDEPTRNLSPLSNPAIRAMLEAYNGAILAVSHDRRFLSEVCDRVLELREDGLHELPPGSW